MTAKKPTTIQDQVLGRIKHGDIKMKSSAYFTILSVVTVIASLAASVAVAYAMSIVFYWWKIQTLDTMARGARANLADAIASFPWWSVVVAILLIGVAVVLIRRYSRMYRHRITTIILIFVLASVALGGLLSALGIGHSVQRGVDHDNNDRGNQQRTIR